MTYGKLSLKYNMLFLHLVFEILFTPIKKNSLEMRAESIQIFV
jgi:hypothetical protein